MNKIEIEVWSHNIGTVHLIIHGNSKDSWEKIKNSQIPAWLYLSDL